jgi:hypothetical protein
MFNGKDRFRQVNAKRGIAGNWRSALWQITKGLQKRSSMGKLWFRSVGSPVNSFLSRVRYFAEGEGGAGAEGAQGASGEGSGAGQGQGEAGKGKEGAGAQDWRANLDPAIKDHPCLKDVKDPMDVIQSWVGVQKMIGVDKLPIPPADAKPEVRNEFLNIAYDRLGRPKTAAEYKLSDVKLPEGVEVKPDAQFIDGLKTEAHKLGLLPHQVDGLYSWYMNSTGNRVKAYNDSVQKSIGDAKAELMSEYGAAYDAKYAIAEKVLNTFSTAEEREHLKKTGFNNDPKIIRMLVRFGESVSDDSFVKGSGESTMTPKEAESELVKIRQQLVDMPKSNPEYKVLEQRRRDLMEMAYINKG